MLALSVGLANIRIKLIATMKHDESMYSQSNIILAELYDMVRMWAKVSLDMLEDVDGFLDLVKVGL